MDNKFNQIIEQHGMQNDKLLYDLVQALPLMGTKDKLTVDLKYADVTRIIKAFITENINLELCEESLRAGIEQYKKEKREKE